MIIFDRSPVSDAFLNQIIDVGARLIYGINYFEISEPLLESVLEGLDVKKFEAVEVTLFHHDLDDLKY